MGYPRRNLIAGDWYHVYARGQRKQPLFFSPVDRIELLTSFDEELFESGGLLAAFCLMTTHYHLAVMMGDVSLSKVIQRAHTRFAHYFNRKHGTVGHVFQGRPGIKRVLDTEYLLTLIAYQHRNPVDAGIVSSPERYRWSSAGLYAGKPLNWIRLKSFAKPQEFSRSGSKHYQELINETSLTVPGNKSYIGTDADIAVVEKRRHFQSAISISQHTKQRRNRPSIAAFIEQICKGTGFEAMELLGRGRQSDVSSARMTAMALAYEAGYSGAELARYFGRSRSLVSYAVKRRGGN